MVETRGGQESSSSRDSNLSAAQGARCWHAAHKANDNDFDCYIFFKK